MKNILYSKPPAPETLHLKPPASGFSSRDVTGHVVAVNQPAPSPRHGRHCSQVRRQVSDGDQNKRPNKQIKVVYKAPIPARI